MANYLSSPYEVIQPTSNINVGLTQQVLALKQGTYDFNKSKIQQTLDSFAQLDLLRSMDKEYVSSKLTQLTSKINSSGNRDLSDSWIADDILNTTKAVANDPVVLNALENTQKFRQFQAQVQKVREKNPELYSDTNYSYAISQSGFDKYMNGDTDAIGNLQYANYVDVTSSALKKVKDLKDLRGKQIIETPDPQNPGQTIKRTLEGLTDQEIFDYIPNILTPVEAQQLTINGWSKYGGNLELAQNNINAYKTEVIEQIDENIENAQSIVNNSAASSEQKKEAQSKLTSYRRQKEQTTAELNAINVNDAASIGGFLERNSWKTGIATMAKSEWSVELEKDEYYFAKADLERNIVKDQREAEKHELDMINTGLDIAKKQKELGVNSDGTVDLNAVTYSAKEGELIEEIDPYSDQLKEFNTVTSEMSGIITTAINSERTPDDIRESYVSELKKRGYDINGNVISGKEKVAAQYPKSLAMKQAFDASNAGTIHSDTAKALAGIEVKRNALATEVDKARVDGLTEVFNKEPDQYIKGFQYRLKEIDVDSQSDSDWSFGWGDSEEDTTLTDLSKKANNFVTENGGWDKLKSTLQKDKVKLKQFAELMSELDNAPTSVVSNVWNFVNPIGKNLNKRGLKEEAAQVSNEKLRERVAQGQSASFTTAQVATIGTETLRTKIVNMLPQTGGTALFDPKNPMSFEKLPNGNIKISQNKGYSDTSKGGYFKKDASVEVSSEDAAFKELTRYTDISDKERGLDATRSNLKVKPTTTVRYLDNTNKTILSRADTAIAQLSPSVLTAFKQTANPAYFLTESRTKEVFKGKLKGILEESKINELVTVMNKNLSKLTPEMKKFDNNWALSVKTSTGKSLVEGDTGARYLEDDWAYLITNFPQVVVSDGVLRYVMENPDQVDSLITTLQQ